MASKPFAVESMRWPGTERVRGPDRALRREIACARALLDELETVTRESVWRDVLAQAADELALVAGMLKEQALAHHGVGGTS
jgi:hypothetical protein